MVLMGKKALLIMGSVSLVLAFFFSAGIYATVNENAEEIALENPAYMLGGVLFYYMFLAIPGVIMILKAFRTHGNKPKLEA